MPEVEGSGAVEAVPAGSRPGTGGVAEVTEAFAAARALLEGAEAEAARIVAEADQHARTRAQEAELLIAKARRVLSVAEDKAAAIVAVARAEARTLVAAQRAGSPGEPVHAPGPPGDQPGPAAELPGDQPVHAPERAPSPPDVAPTSGRGPGLGGHEPSGLDRVLAAAIATAVDRALDPEGIFRR